MGLLDLLGFTPPPKSELATVRVNAKRDMDTACKSQ